MRLRGRLQRLEQRLGRPDLGCPACRDRCGRHVLVTAERLPDGTLTHPDGDPKRCGRCGEVPELVILIVETVVESPEPGSEPAACGSEVVGENR